MELFNLLANAVQIPFYNEMHSISLDFIGKFIRWLVTISGSVGIGIILFSLALKTVTLPFDIFQRITMRKQNIQMKKNQAQMEKLQKQYANNKELYNQKVMEMYKQNGMSMFSSCLPMILSLVIFFIAIGAFNSYASYANVENYNTLVGAYNQSVSSYSVTDEELKAEHITAVYNQENNSVIYTVKGDGEEEYLYYTVSYSLKEGEVYEEDLQKAQEYIKGAAKTYYVDMDKVNNTTDAQMKTDIQAIIDEYNAKLAAGEMELDTTNNTVEEIAVKDYFIGKSQDAVVVKYDESVKNNTTFLWIKNIWVTDASYKHPVLGYSDFSTQVTERSTCSCSANEKVTGIPAYDEHGYKNVTAKLTVEKNQANGYFILIALSIGTILLQQFLSMRAQKEQQKYSTVDGQGGSQQKMMLVIMTGMFAIFSFMYSSAFSIYLIVSNLFSMASMFIINKCVDASEKRKQAASAEVKSQSYTAKRIEEAKNAGRQSAQKSREKDGEESPKKKKK